MSDRSVRRRRVTLVCLPREGEVVDRVTHRFFKNDVVKYMPLGLLSVATAIAPEHDVTVLDASSKGWGLEETIAAIERSAPEVLGISAVTYRAWAMTEILQRTTAPLKVVGGPHTAHNAEVVLGQGAHAVFVGDGERTFPRWLREGCSAGIFSSPSIPLDDLPVPNRRLLDLDDYRVVPNENLLFNVGSLRLPLFSSKGCPMKCTFCDVKEKTYNWSSPQKVIAEFRELIELGATSVHILDDNFNVRKSRVIEICKLLTAARRADERFAIDWSARCAVEVREDVVDALAEGGCKRIHVGIEHLDDEVLATFQKRHRHKDVERFCALCHQRGIQIVAYFIFGAPGETRQYRASFPQRVRDLGIAMPFFNVLTPLDHTVYLEQLLASGQLARDFWQDFIRQPVREFEIPTVRTPALEHELEETIDWYIQVFNKHRDVPTPASLTAPEGEGRPVVLAS